MHYYKRNIGDYAKKAGRLSMLQHGAYTLLIDACYDREQFPTHDEAIEWTWASSQAEIEAVEFVLKKFFVLENGVYVQNRIHEEIDEYRIKSEQNSRIAKEREMKREENNTKRARIVNESSPEEHESPPNQEPLTTNQEPLTTNQDKDLASSKLDAMQCPAEKIVDAYHRLMPENPKCKVLNSARRGAIKARWNEAAKLDCVPFGYSTAADGLEAWENFFEICSTSAFLTGKAKPQPGKPPFFADIDFLMSPAAFAKCLENKYHRDAP